MQLVYVDLNGLLENINEQTKFKELSYKTTSQSGKITQRSVQFIFTKKEKKEEVWHRSVFISRMKSQRYTLKFVVS